MDNQSLVSLLRTQPFFDGFTDTQLNLLQSCAKEVDFNKGVSIAKEADDADYFYIIREGQVAVELISPGKPALIIQTIGAGEIFGWSWIFPPYKWSFGARAVSDVSAIAFDGRCLRARCEQDMQLGYRFMKAFAYLISRRLGATRLQLLDMYGNGHS